MADPTTAAYNRINSRGAVRPQIAPTLAVPNLDLQSNVEYQNKFAAWSMIRDCYDGEAVIKAAGQIYLPKLSAHSPAEYEIYKNRAYFYNAVRRTHRGLMGSLFRKPVEVTLPESLKSKVNLSRITQDAHSFAAFTRTLGHEVLLTGRFGVLADFKGTNWQSPYLAGYLAENIYSWRLAEYNDREVVDRVVLLESETVPTEYGTTSRLLIRILRLDPDPDRAGKYRYWQTEIRPEATGNELMVKNIDVKVRGGRRLEYIPFVFVNATDLRADVGPAPLEDIATINISHFQSTAHLEHGRFYAGMPTYVTSGAGGGSSMPGLPDGLANPSPLTVGPSFVWELEENAKAWLLEFNGHGLVFLENAVDSKQLQMQSLGGRLISSTRRAAAMSDEAWHLLETGDEATLMDVAMTADEGMAKALTYLGDIMGEVTDLEDSGITVEFNKEFVRSELTARELRALQSLAERAHIPRDVMYYALREVGVIPVEYTLEEFNKMMDQQSQIWKDPNPPPAPGGPAPTGRPGVRPQPPRNVNNGGTDGQGGS